MNLEAKFSIMGVTSHLLTHAFIDAGKEYLVSNGDMNTFSVHGKKFTVRRVDRGQNYMLVCATAEGTDVFSYRTMYAIRTQDCTFSWQIPGLKCRAFVSMCDSKVNIAIRYTEIEEA